MSTALPGRLYAVIAVLVLLLAACGDVTVNGGYPDMDFTGYWWWPDNTDHTAHRTLSILEPMEGRLRIHLEAFSGSVAIVGEPGAGSMRLTAKLTAGSDTQEDAQAGLDLLGIVLTRLPEEIHVQTDQPEIFDGRQYVVDYVLHVPGDLEVLVTQTNGNIQVENMDNTVTVDAGNGFVQLLSINGDTFVSLFNGDIDSTVTLPPGGEIMLSTVNGDIDLRIPTWTSAILSAFSVNGTNSWYNLPLTEVEFTTRSLTGILGDGNGVIDLETVNGNNSIMGF